MKKAFTLLAATILSLGILSARAQGGGPSFGGAMGKLFGDNQSFSASLEFQTADPATRRELTMPGKLSFASGRSRFEMNLAEVKGGAIPPNAIAQMKEMGMDRITSISLPDKKVTYLIYPGMQSYVEGPATADAAGTNDFQISTTAIGKESFGGHDCVKNLVIVTDKDGKKHQSIVWNATDLKKFPVKIDSSEQGRQFVMVFKNISLAVPDAATFEVPSSYTKYSSAPEMMQAMIAKKMGGAAARPPGQ